MEILRFRGQALALAPGLSTNLRDHPLAAPPHHSSVATQGTGATRGQMGGPPEVAPPGSSRYASPGIPMNFMEFFDFYEAV